jgi:hypothetical protein
MTSVVWSRPKLSVLRSSHVCVSCVQSHNAILHIMAFQVNCVGNVPYARTRHSSAEFQGILASGKQVSITAIDIVRFEAGKIIEQWGVADQWSMLQQLGAMPSPG